jgi:hypothetical protein
MFWDEVKQIRTTHPGRFPTKAVIGNWSQNHTPFRQTSGIIEFLPIPCEKVWNLTTMTRVRRHLPIDLAKGDLVLVKHFRGSSFFRCEGYVSNFRWSSLEIWISWNRTCVFVVDEDRESSFRESSFTATAVRDSLGSYIASSKSITGGLMSCWEKSVSLATIASFWGR